LLLIILNYFDNKIKVKIKYLLSIMKQDNFLSDKRKTARKIAVRQPARLSCSSHKYQVKKNRFKSKGTNK